MRLLLVTAAVAVLAVACGPSANTPPSVANAPGGATPNLEQALARGDSIASAVFASVEEKPVGPSTFRLVTGEIAIPDQTALFKSLGFEISGTDIVVNQSKESGEALGRLGLLLKLASNPDVLQDPQAAQSYAIFLTPEECDSFFVRQCVGWKGKTQFEKQDVHTRFVAQMDARLKSLIPKFPFTVIEKRMGYVQAYNDQTSTLGFAMTGDGGGAGGVWDANRGYFGPTSSGLSTPVPFVYPTSLSMTRDQARSITERLLEKNGRQNTQYVTGTVGTRYLATGIRPGERGGNVMDLLVYTQALYSDTALTDKLLDLPLNEMTLTVAPQPASTEPAYFDDLLPRILAAKLRPALLDDEAFLRETLKLRRVTESQTGGYAHVSNWPAMVPASLRESDRLAYTPEDIARTRAWLADAANRIGNTTRIKYVCGNDISAERCRGGGQETANGHMFSPASHIERSIKAGALRANPDSRPASQGFFSYDAGSDINVIYSRAASPHWFGIAVPFDWNQAQHVSMDLTILSAQFTKVGNDEVLLIDIAPRSLTYITTAGAAPQTLDLSTIPLPAGPKPSATGGYYEIAGITIGMPLSEAEGKAKAALPGDAQREEMSEPKAYGLTNSVSLRAPSGQEAIELFYDPEDPQQRVTAIGRAMRTQDKGADYSTVEPARIAMLARFDEKYGPADTIHDQGNNSYWVADPIQKARFAAERENSFAHNPCKIKPNASIGVSRGAVFYDPPPACGEIMSVQFGHGGEMYIWVVDTTQYNTLRARQEKAAAPVVKLNDAPL